MLLIVVVSVATVTLLLLIFTLSSLTTSLLVPTVNVFAIVAVPSLSTENAVIFVPCASLPWTVIDP